jgi:hypothetical protein
VLHQSSNSRRNARYPQKRRGPLSYSSTELSNLYYVLVKLEMVVSAIEVISSTLAGLQLALDRHNTQLGTPVRSMTKNFQRSQSTWCMRVVRLSVPPLILVSSDPTARIRTCVQ